MASPGRRFEWSRADWDAYIQARNLVAESEYSAEAVIRQQGSALVDEYLGRYLHEQTDLPEMVATAIQADGRRSSGPTWRRRSSTATQSCCTAHPSWARRLWARTLSAQIARDGHVPVWLAADLCRPSFRDSMARAIVPYHAHPQ